MFLSDAVRHSYPHTYNPEELRHMTDSTIILEDSYSKVIQAHSPLKSLKGIFLPAIAPWII